MKALIMAFSCFILLLACGAGERENALKLATEKQSLNCEMERLRGQTATLWDEMEAYLDKNLPADMPPAERANMVTIRNANLITMFKAFTKLDTAIQQKVNEAGAADRSIAEGMKSVKEKLDKVEQAMNEALLKVQAHSDRQYQQLKEELHGLENKPCRL
ncbi:MAG: hypothetical protein IPN76_29900 [Saprospiraceae bacterium]|nr:hypothetical protein [Saprospiraceae bacterium]